MKKGKSITTMRIVRPCTSIVAEGRFWVIVERDRRAVGERFIAQGISFPTTIDARPGGLQANSPGKRDIVSFGRGMFWAIFCAFLGVIRWFSGVECEIKRFLRAF
jgi:hypothetical protein